MSTTATETVFLVHRDGDCPCRHFNGYSFCDPKHQCRARIVIAQVIRKVPYQYRFEGSNAIYRAPFSSPCFADSDPHGVCQCPKQSFPQRTEEPVNATSSN